MRISTRQLLSLAVLIVSAVVAHAQWEMQNANTTADLRGIHSIGGGVAWASGTNGTVLRTEDSGYVWQTCAVPPGAEHLDFRGIQAFDANTAIVMSSGKGDLSRLYKTTDGCSSWKLVFTNPDAEGFWDAVLRSGARTVLMIGDPVPQTKLDHFKIRKFFHFPLYGSLDAGEKWKRLDSNNLFAMSEGKDRAAQSIFAASNSSLLEISDHRLILYATGGKRVSLGVLETIDHSIPLICNERCFMSSSSNLPLASGPSAGAFSIAVDDNDSSDPSLVAVGGDYTLPEAKNGTAAVCWRENSLPIATQFQCDPATTPPHGYRSAVAYDEKNKTWITVGPNGTDISTDDGRNWRALKPDPARHEAADADRNWNALSLPFVVGPHGRIGKLREDALASQPANAH